MSVRVTNVFTCYGIRVSLLAFSCYVKVRGCQEVVGYGKLTAQNRGPKKTTFGARGSGLTDRTGRALARNPR
jgi:hypothetical protein